MSKELAVKQEPSVALMLQAVIDKGVTSDNVVALEKLCELYERMQARDAERQFNEAFVELMKEIPKIRATKAVPNNDGTARYYFAPLEEIDAQLRPMALKHGFTYSFSEGQSQPNEVTKVCTVCHSAGHKRSNGFSVTKSAPPKATATQADGSTHSYAKRGALCDAFGIIVHGMDDDARLKGRLITAEQAEELKARVRACGANEVAFLKYAGATDYDGIPESRYEALDAMLRRKESRVEPEEKNEQGEYKF
jgi:hypothetical protein